MRRQIFLPIVMSVIGIFYAAFDPSVGLGTENAPSTPAIGHLDLQAQIKVTATKVISGVVNISSTVLVRDQAPFDEGPLFGTLPQTPPQRQYGQGSSVLIVMQTDTSSPTIMSWRMRETWKSFWLIDGNSKAVWWPPIQRPMWRL